jgi:hypothetical protein
MKQLKLPLPLAAARLEHIKFRANGLLEYIKEHPSDLLMALILVLLMDIEDDIDDLGAN